MPVCSFCKRRFKEPRGLTVFTFDGRSVYYCSGKCRKNMEHLRRDPKKIKWVEKREGFLEQPGNGEAVETEKSDNLSIENKKDKAEGQKK